MVAKDTEALDWLQNNGEVYFEFLFATNSVGTPWGMVEAIMSQNFGRGFRLAYWESGAWF